MTKANEKMKRYQEEIERVKAETREILARLKAARVLPFLPAMGLIASDHQ
jgi:hypothetical protein